MRTLGVLLAASTAASGVWAAPAVAVTTAVTPDGRAPAATTMIVTPSDFSATGRVVLTGTKQEGNGVEITTGAARSRVCLVEADDDTSWECENVALPNGPAIELEATEVPPDDAQVVVPRSDTATIAVLGPPGMDGFESYLTTGLVSGTGYPGALVRISIDGVVDPRCQGTPVNSSGLWSCNVAAPSGAYVIRTQQSHSGIENARSSGFSAPRYVTVDRDAPASAAITAPADGASVAGAELVVSGTGEEAATVDVYLDNIPNCQATVRSGTWSCEVSGVDVGTHEVHALQRDAAGNFAAPGPRLTVTRALPAAPAPVLPSRPGTPAPAPAPATPSPTKPHLHPTPTDPAEVTPAPGASEPPAEAPGSPAPEAPEDAGDGQDVGTSTGVTEWAEPTGFATGLADQETSTTPGPWLLALLLGLLFLTLIVLPLTLLLATMRGRIALPRVSLLGRNRTEVRPARHLPDDEAAPRSNPSWRAPLAALAVTAVVVVLTGPVQGEVRYLRLLLAVLAGLLVVNALAVLSARLAGARLVDPRSSNAEETPADDAGRGAGLLRPVPLLLAAAIAGAVVSRIAGIDPPLLAGVLVAAAIAPAIPARRPAGVDLVQVGTLLTVGIGAWLLRMLLPLTGQPSAGGQSSGAVGGSVPAASAVWGTFFSEMLATMCLAALGSALLLVLPIPGLPGSRLRRWSPFAWVASVVVVATVLALITVGAHPAVGSLLSSFGIAVAFAALSLATWAFVRFVEPQLRV